MDNAPNFSHFDKLKIGPNSRALYTFEGIEGEPVLEVSPAHEVNKPYMNAILKKGKKMLRSLKRGSMSVQTLKENRLQDLRLFPKFIVTGWLVAPVDSAGNKVEFSEENCKAFLQAIPTYMFNDLREFCADVDSFLDEDDDLDVDDREELAKN